MLNQLILFLTEHLNTILLSIFFLSLTYIDWRRNQTIKFTALFFIYYVIGELGLNSFSDSLVDKNAPVFFSNILISGLSPIVNFFISLILFELIVYITHRAAHRYDFLWNFHRVHHNQEVMTWTISHKVHFIDQLITGFLLQTVFLNIIDPINLVFIIGFILSPIYHSNLKVTLPNFIENSIITMKVHHWHHSKSMIYPSGQNFGFILTLFDRLFGTYYNPSHFPTDYGIDEKSTMSLNPLIETLHPLQSILQKAKKYFHSLF